MAIKKPRAWGIVAVLAFLLWMAGSVHARPLADPSIDRANAGSLPEVGVSVAVAPLLQYQARLTDPGTGEPVADANPNYHRATDQATDTTYARAITCAIGRAATLAAL